MARKVIYAESLHDLSRNQIDYAFGMAIKTCKFFPQVSELREFAEAWRPPDQSQSMIDREGKPDDLSDQERKELADDLVAQMRARIEAGALTMPSYRENAESLAAERNGLTKVPVDPEERRTWAMEAAKRQGWVS